MAKSPTKVDEARIREAARAILAGQLVVFPTETVYGLGANALDAAAVERIFEVKGRPPTSPLIVHVDSIGMARRLVTEWPDRAGQLAEAFWPGALTLVLPKNPIVPDRVTAGLPTVAIRLPSHPIACALIAASGVPIAAPSANRFTQLSPTTAGHVRQGLGDRVAMILDDGPTDLGIESTVLSLTGPNAVLLRPGMLSATAIEAIIGPLQSAPDPRRDTAHASPGLHRKHYSPRTPVLLVDGDSLPGSGRGAYLWITRPTPACQSVPMPADPSSYAAILYATLHRLDAEGLDWIAIERPPEDPRWAGILDRLERAAG